MVPQKRKASSPEKERSVISQIRRKLPGYSVEEEIFSHKGESLKESGIGCNQIEWNFLKIVQGRDII